MWKICRIRFSPLILTLFQLKLDFCRNKKVFFFCFFLTVWHYAIYWIKLQLSIATLLLSCAITSSSNFLLNKIERYPKTKEKKGKKQRISNKSRMEAITMLHNVCVKCISYSTKRRIIVINFAKLKDIKLIRVFS